MPRWSDALRDKLWQGDLWETIPSDKFLDKLGVFASTIFLLMVLIYEDLNLAIALFLAGLSLVLIGLLPYFLRTSANFLHDRLSPGIIRDPDPVEAAVLMRVAPGRILTIIMFGLMKKGNIKLTSIEPVRLEIVSMKGLNYYEKLFVDAIKDDLPVEPKMIDCFRTLNQRVLDKTRPSDRERMAGQCRERIAGAWNDLESVDTPELKQRKFNDHVLWLIADEEYARKITEDLRVPVWDTFSISVNRCWYPDPVIAGADYPASSQDLRYAVTNAGERTAWRSVSDPDRMFSWGEAQNPFFNIPGLERYRP